MNTKPTKAEILQNGFEATIKLIFKSHTLSKTIRVYLFAIAASAMMRMEELFEILKMENAKIELENLRDYFRNKKTIVNNNINDDQITTIAEKATKYIIEIDIYFENMAQKEGVIDTETLQMIRYKLDLFTLILTRIGLLFSKIVTPDCKSAKKIIDHFVETALSCEYNSVAWVRKLL